ncbi:DUF3953 domain-containing protein [Ferdinandcohnia sp. Marseille-Q9671]
MLQLARIGLAIIVILFVGYGLFTEDFVYQSYMMFSLGLLMLVMGVEEFRRDRRALGWLCVAVFLFTSYVSIQGFFIN